mmetsp:Transcript_11224/g.9607  ORF Transcript_11224/g.9607 Transcript_11224/m.9607 type:complete len:319 (+) Transcript_11224:110-1066(+)|eukprot:CAMPEP_0114580102 /NCGR_PEP_ID=MMETSP0125-20121206/4438_1 /TAXON_ID=485358 ORGANISM="Aristerostoma sp., Strain ATCC 50986" /NCGR_SAMPLE_ID=MMETSP0125 /ASSEMBLY_ACC=CAM_ASM_000245 /LENGTH=318 /DNA_ID=CAMNT_0001771429 /DNA_START=31 /DNA_END=987 /DNA_ORIENTATION=+
MNKSKGESTDTSMVSYQSSSTTIDTSKIDVGTKIAHETYPVYDAEVQGHENEYALKFFPYEKKQLNAGYKNEVRFCSLMHPNIIAVKKTEDDFYVKSNGRHVHVSLILMEKAKFGTLTSKAKVFKTIQTENVARSYFAQLIRAIDYLHQRFIAHFDITTDNLLLDENFCLKLADFDKSYMEGDRQLRFQGSEHFRAPELIENNDPQPFKCDIYSAGIILFVLNFGHLPYYENKKIHDQDLYELLHNDKQKFWEFHQNIVRREISEDFKDLFEAMTDKDPIRRANLKYIKEHNWFKGSKYADYKLKNIMMKHMIPYYSS